MSGHSRKETLAQKNTMLLREKQIPRENGQEKEEEWATGVVRKAD